MKSYCHKCNAEMTPSFWDNTYRMDGSVTFSGYACPNCATKVVMDGLKQMRETTKSSTEKIDTAMQTVKEIAPLLNMIFSLSPEVKADIGFAVEKELEITESGIKVKANISSNPHVLKKEKTVENLKSISKSSSLIRLENLVLLYELARGLLEIYEKLSENSTLIHQYIDSLIVIIASRSFY